MNGESSRYVSPEGRVYYIPEREWGEMRTVPAVTNRVAARIFSEENFREKLARADLVDVDYSEQAREKLGGVKYVKDATLRDIVDYDSGRTGLHSVVEDFQRMMWERTKEVLSERVRRIIRTAIFDKLTQSGVPAITAVCQADELTKEIMSRLESLDPTMLERPAAAEIYRETARRLMEQGES